MCSRQHPQPTQRPGHAWVPDRVSCAAGTPRSINSDTAPTPQTHTHKHPAHPNTPPPPPLSSPNHPRREEGDTEPCDTEAPLLRWDIKAPRRRRGGEWQPPASPPAGIPPQSSAAARGPPTHSSLGGRARSCVGQRREHRFAERAAGNGRWRVGGSGASTTCSPVPDTPTHPSVPTPSVPPPNTHLLLGAGALLVVGQRAARGGHRFQQLRHRASVGGGGQEWGSKKGGGGISACPRIGGEQSMCVVCFPPRPECGVAAGWGVLREDEGVVWGFGGS